MKDYQIIKIGRSFAVNVYKSGISLWYKGDWIVDASMITKTRRVRVRKNKDARLKFDIEAQHSGGVASKCGTANTGSPKLFSEYKEELLSSLRENDDDVLKTWWMAGAKAMHSIFIKQLRAGA